LAEPYYRAISSKIICHKHFCNIIKSNFHRIWRGNCRGSSVKVNC
jgi:hypothetical protein